MSFKESLNNGKNTRISISPEIQALIFDCDGTLVDSMPTHMKAWEHAFKFFNTAYDENFLFSFKGMKDTDIVQIYNETFGTKLNAQDLVSKKIEYFIQNLNNVKPIKPVVDVALSYYKKLPLAVVSGSLKSVVYAELNFVNILKLFDIIITADDPFKPKPDPEIFLAAATQLKVHPEFCMVFEDGDAGLESADKAGMKTFDVRTMYTG